MSVPSSLQFPPRHTLEECLKTTPAARPKLFYQWENIGNIIQAASTTFASQEMTSSEVDQKISLIISRQVRELPARCQQDLEWDFFNRLLSCAEQYKKEKL